MKKYLFRLLTLAVIVPALASCAGQLEDNLSQAKKHTVYFSTVVDGQATRTGLTIADGIVTPDWRETNPEDIHVFEINGSNAHLGEASAIDPYDDNLGAHFTADIETDMTIIVTPPGAPTGDGAKVLRQGPITYGAVVAKMRKDAPVFYIPAVQTPDAETLKDPDAEFLVGYSRDGYPEVTINDNGTIVDLYFDRVAALSRIGFSEFQGTNEKVMSVKINSATSMTGSVTANAISFGNPNSVTFTPDEGAGVLTLDYGKGVSVTEETFYAYFVSMPGTFDITSIEILTDQYRYTKEINKEGGFEFTLTELKNLKLTGTTAEKVTQERVYTKVTSTADLEVGAQYLLVFEGLAGDTDGDGDPKVFKPILATETTFTKGDTNKMDVVISANTIYSNDYEACHFTLEAGYYLKSDAVGRYIYSATTSSSGQISAEATASHPLTISFDNGIADIRNANAYCLVWSTSNHYFSAQSQPSTDYSTGICLYKLDDGRQAQELSFSSESAEYDFYSSTWTVAVPTLSGVQTSATYALSEDSDPEVATVDASTGEVTIGTKTGTVTIVATATGNSQYKPGSASYTLTVVNNDPNVKVYRKVTSTAGLEVGAQYLLVFEGLAGDTDGDGDPKVFKPILATETTFTKGDTNKMDVVISANTIYSNDYEACHFTLEAGYYLKSDAVGRYIYSATTSSSGQISAEATASHPLTISFDNGIADIRNANAYCLVWSTSNHYFSAQSQPSTDYSTGICLYKLDDGREPQSPSFSPTEVNYDIAGSAALTKPTLSDAHGTVTYTSSDTDIATVDLNSGDVTVKNRGTVTITANAAGDTSYKPGSASYTLVIINSSIVDTYYVLVTSEPASWDGTYLIVNTAADGTGVAMNNTSTANVTISGGKILSTPEVDGYALTVTSAGEVHPNQTDANQGLIAYDINFSDGEWLYWYSNAYKQNTETLSSRHNKCTLLYDNGGVRLMSAGYNVNLSGGSITAPSKNYLYYESSGFSMSSSQSSARVQLYMLDDGREAQVLGFTPATATFDLYAPTSFIKPTLSSPTYGTITYSSSNATVAEVDNSGNITGKKTGKVTITATAAGDAQHKPGSASYELTVTNSAPVTTTTYYLASSIEAGKHYLVVSNGMALTNDNGIASTSVTATNNEIVLNDDDASSMLWEATSKGSGFTLSNGGSFIQRASQSGNPSVGSAPSDNYYIWAYDNSNQYLYTASGTKYYLYYSSNNNRWSQNSSASSSRTVTLYTASSGGDPEPPTTSTYSLITTESQLESGASYLIVSAYNSPNEKVFAGDQDGTAVTVSASSGTITGAYSDYEYVISKKSGTDSDYTLLGKSGYLTGNSSSGDRYIQISSSEVTMSLTNATELANASSGDGQVADAFYFYYTKTSSGTTTKEVLYFNSDGKFKIGGSGRKYGVYLYKKVENP